ncbi:MAG: hypothetical protein JXR78_08640 [Victivallales bacterium]|nr:hypothetical protein [Victivallales bacterium]
MKVSMRCIFALIMLAGSATFADAMLFDGSKATISSTAITADPENADNKTARWNPRSGGSWGMTLTPEFKDWSEFSAFQFKMYSAKADNHEMMLSFSSDPEGAQGNYYFKKFKLDWTGWKTFALPFSEFSKSRNPVGWSKIDKISFNFKGWGMTPNLEAQYHLDDLLLISGSSKKN